MRNIYIYTYTKQDYPFLEPLREDHSLHNCKGQRVHIADPFVTHTMHSLADGPRVYGILLGETMCIYG